MGRSLDEHTAKQLTDDYADDCILGALARACDKSITVVHLTGIRSLTPLSVDIDGPVENSVWVACNNINHYY
eukprot:7821170-Pyramimonas_sp.AAC.1